MRPYLVITTLALFAFGFSAQAADLPSPPQVIQPPRPHVHVVQPVCGEQCDIYKHTVARPLAPPTDTVCIPLKQAKRGIVVIRFYNEKGNELDAGNRQHSNIKNVVDQFCVGRHYLQEARTGHVEVCNDVDTKTLRPQEIEILLSQGMPANHWVYLLAHR